MLELVVYQEFRHDRGRLYCKLDHRKNDGDPGNIPEDGGEFIEQRSLVVCSTIAGDTLHDHAVEQKQRRTAEKPQHKAVNRHHGTEVGHTRFGDAEYRADHQRRDQGQYERDDAQCIAESAVPVARVYFPEF